MDSKLSEGVINNLLDQVDQLKEDVQSAEESGPAVVPPPSGLTMPSLTWSAEKPPAQLQDFIKGWPSIDMLATDHLRTAMSKSFKKAITQWGEGGPGAFLNYGDASNGAYMLGTPDFRKTMATYLSGIYNRPVAWETIMSTGGGSMGTDLILRQHCKHGDAAIVEEPTYFLSHTMLRDRGMTNLLGVPMQSDGLDLEAVEKHCIEQGGKVKALYTVSIHHNPTGITLSNEKRVKLVALAKKYDFLIISDEAYQLVSFDDTTTDIVPLYYHDDPEDPRVFSVGTFSKVIGPGLKVGWIQAHPSLLKKIPDVGFIDSGNNPVIFTSAIVTEFIASGELERHRQFVCKELGKKSALLSSKLREVGVTDFVEPHGGYFVWARVAGSKRTGKSGEPCSINRDKFGDMMRLCFAWLTPEQIVEGIEAIRE